jgi:thiol-disulfide isomerase/thioredoxin
MSDAGGRAEDPPDGGERDTPGTASSRRRFLGVAAAAGAASLAGCLGGGGASDREVIELETLAVGGSPGGTVPLRPPDRLALLDFFATWCAPCRPQMDSLRQVRSTFAPEQLHMVSITTESDREAVRNFWTTYEGTWPVATDPPNPQSRSIQTYGVRGVPTLVLVSPDGTVRWRHQGLAGVDSLLGRIRRALDA